MSNPTNRAHSSDHELPPQGAHMSSTLPLSDEQELDNSSEHEDDGSVIVGLSRHDGPHHDAQPSQWAEDVRRSTRFPFAHPLGAVTSPPSPPSRIPIPTYAQAVLRHYTLLRRVNSLPRNVGRMNLHQIMESLQEEGDDDAAVERNPANTPLSPDQGRMNLHEPRENLQHQHQHQQREEIYPVTPLVRSPRMWNLHDVQEAIRQNEENGYDPPTPPPVYQEAILMPLYELNGGQTSGRSDGGNQNENEAQHDQAARPRLFQGFRRLDSPDTPTIRFLNPTLRVPTLTQTPPPPYRSPSEDSIDRTTQSRDLFSRLDAQERDVSGGVVQPESLEMREATENAQDSTTESREAP